MKYVTNTAMIADLCALKNTQISVVGRFATLTCFLLNGIFRNEPMRGIELARKLRSGKLKLAEGPPRKLLFEFISVYSERMTQLLSK